MTVGMKIGFFDSILSSGHKHPKEMYSWFGRMTQWYFNFGQNTYKIDSKTFLYNGCIPVVRELHKQNVFLTTLKIFFIGITTLTVIIPVMMLVCLRVYRSKNRFVLLKVPSDNLNQIPISNEKPLKLSPILPIKSPKGSPKQTSKQIKLQNLELLNLIFSEKKIVNKIMELKKKLDLILHDPFDLSLYIEVCYQKKILHHLINYLRLTSKVPSFLEKAWNDLITFRDMIEQNFIINLDSDNFRFIRTLQTLESELKVFKKINEIPESLIENYTKSVEVLKKIQKYQNSQSNYYDVEFYKKIYNYIIPKGIPNIGNSCYMNSGLQVLVGISFFRDLIASNTWKPCIIYSKQENENEVDQIKRIEIDEKIFKETVDQYKQIHSNFQNFSNAYQEGLSLEIPAKKIRNALYEAELIEGKKSSQQDAEIFFRTLISSSGYSMLSRRRLISNSENEIQEIKFPVDRQSSFTISMKEFEEHGVFSLSFQELVNQEFSEKKLCFDDPYIEKGYEKETYKYEEAPDYVILNIKRFGNDLQKYNEEFVFENGEVVDFSVAMSKGVLDQSVDKNFLYEPIGMIQHHGRSREYGHYTADVKKNGLWFHCNDAQVEEVGLINPNLGNGYIYCFKRINSNVVSPIFPH